MVWLACIVEGTIVYGIYISLLNQSPIFEYLEDFEYFAITNKAILTNLVHMHFHWLVYEYVLT